MDEYQDIPSDSSESVQPSGQNETAPDNQNDYSEIISAIEDVAGKLDGIDGKIGGVSDDVATLVTLSDGTAHADMDYSGQLETLGQNLALCNVLMVVLVVVVFLLTGLTFGNSIVSWFKGER